MSIYGETNNQFRVRPARGVITAFTVFSTLIGLVTGPILYSIARTLFTRTIRSDYLFNVHAPLGANPSLGLFPLYADQIVTSSAVAVASVAIITALFVAFYPSSQKLANRLALFSICTAIIATGAIAPIADLGLLRSLSRWREISTTASGGILAAAIVILLLIVVWLERRTISLLGNLFDVDTPLRRFVLWALRVPLPWGAFAVVSYLSDWWGGVITALAVAGATLIDDLTHFPHLGYEALDQPRMREGLAGAAIVAVVLFAASVWTFGLPAARRAPHALVLENGQFSRVPVSELTPRIYEETMPRIDMKWSNER